MFEYDSKHTRDAFGKTVFEYAQKDDRIVAIGGDSVASMGLVTFQNNYPDRVFNLGIAEQNVMAAAAGLAAVGFKVVCAGFAPFMTMRAVEQFRTFIAYPNLDVKIAGGVGGLSAGTEGVTHQGLEDYGIMRLFPNTVIAIPADWASTCAITRALLDISGPTYLRTGKVPFKKIFDNNYKFEIGKANLLTEGTDATIIAAGAVLPNVLEACELLKNENIQVRVLEMPCIKPIDKRAIISAALETGAIVTVEDHFVTGGLGSAVAEVLIQNAPVKIKCLGIPDKFTESGEHYALLDKYGMSVQEVVKSVKELVKGKQIH